MRAFFREVLVTFALALIIYLGARATLQTYVVIMTSMEPNFHEGQWVVVNKALYFFGEPQRGDVVIFREPNGQRDDYIKRIIGLPGDTVEVKSGAVYVNGVRLKESYLKNPPNYTMAKETIPKNDFFVLGDNRNISNDSHYGWLLPRGNIIGKAWISTWPPSEWGIVRSYPLKEQLVNKQTSTRTALNYLLQVVWEAR
jgi:signal peptidase I